MDKEFEEARKAFAEQARALGPETNKPWRVKKKCSLFEIINTKKKAEVFMRQLKSLQ